MQSEEEINETKEDVSDLLDFGFQLSQRPRTQQWFREVPPYSSAFMNWFCEYFERESTSDSIFGNSLRHDFVFLVDNDLSRAYRSYKDVTLANPGEFARAMFKPAVIGPNNAVIEILTALTLSYLNDMTLADYLGGDNDDREDRFYEAIRLALNWALWGEEVERYDSVPDARQLSKAFTEGVYQSSPREINFADMQLVLLMQVLGKKRKRPFMVFYKDDPGSDVWSVVVFKNLRYINIPLYTGPLVEAVVDDDDDAGGGPDDLNNDNPDPDVILNNEVMSDEEEGPRLRREIGTKLEVWRGIANRTKGGLRKEALMRNKKCKIVSIKASKSAKGRHNNIADPGRAALASWREVVQQNDNKFPNLGAIQERREIMVGDV